MEKNKRDTQLAPWQENLPPCATSSWPDLWFSNRERDAQKAQAICHTCPFRVACLAAALHQDTDGIWAGLTRRQRKSLTNPLRRQGVTTVSKQDALGIARAHFRTNSADNENETDENGRFVV